MKIHTLGTSHGNSTFCRFNSSTVYKTKKGTLYLIGAGAPAEALLRRKGLLMQNIKAAFITHMHEDHAGGLTGVIKQVVKYPNKRELPLALYLPEESAIEALRGWMLALHENVDSPLVAYRAVNDGCIYEDEQLLVQAIRTCHLRTQGREQGEPCSFAYVLVFKEEGLRILHTGDLRGDFSDFPKIALEQKFDVCVCEATHYAPEDALGTLIQAGFGRLIFNHIADRWHTHVQSAWTLVDGERALLDNYRELPYPVQIAHDGDSF